MSDPQHSAGYSRFHSRPQQPPEYRAKLHLLTELRALSSLTDAERAEMNRLSAEVEAAELVYAQAQAGSLGGAL